MVTHSDTEKQTSGLPNKLAQDQQDNCRSVRQQELDNFYVPSHQGNAAAGPTDLRAHRRHTESQKIAISCPKANSTISAPLQQYQCSNASFNPWALSP